VVFLDLRHLGANLINTKLPFVRELCLKYENIDPVKQLIPVRPVVHYMMGGVSTDINGATPVRGLYAAGETACVSINGANRLGSNSLPELLVFGARAGKVAAEHARSCRDFNIATLTAQAEDERRRLVRRYLSGPRGKERVATIREEMQKTLEAGAGIYRSGDTLQQAAADLRELQRRGADVGIDDRSHTFNTELISALELECMLDVAETIIACASRREESRGAHQRLDFPKRDDTKWLTHSLVSRNSDGTPRLDYKPVTITRWPPGERVYGTQKSDKSTALPKEDLPKEDLPKKEANA
jgi:fumarate reductase flavoprotein subunit